MQAVMSSSVVSTSSNQVHLTSFHYKDSGMTFSSRKTNASVPDVIKSYNPSYLISGQTAKTGIRFTQVHEATKFRVFYSKMSIVKCALSSGSQYHCTNIRTEPKFDPFWLSFIKDVLWGCRSLVLFLLEQPSQLKYIEWPSFQSTMKIATLTIVIVAVLLVLLSSTDAALSFILALILKKQG